MYKIDEKKDTDSMIEMKSRRKSKAILTENVIFELDSQYEQSQCVSGDISNILESKLHSKESMLKLIKIFSTKTQTHKFGNYHKGRGLHKIKRTNKTNATHTKRKSSGKKNLSSNKKAPKPNLKITSTLKKNIKKNIRTYTLRSSAVKTSNNNLSGLKFDNTPIKKKAQTKEFKTAGVINKDSYEDDDLSQDKNNSILKDLIDEDWEDSFTFSAKVHGQLIIEENFAIWKLSKTENTIVFRSLLEDKNYSIIETQFEINCIKVGSLTSSFLDSDSTVKGYNVCLIGDENIEVYEIKFDQAHSRSMELTKK